MSTLDTLKMTRLTRHHVNQIANLHKAAFEAGWVERDFVDNLQNDLDDIWGLVDIGNDGSEMVCGFILTRTLDDQAEILTLVVNASLTGRGLGRALLKTSERTAIKRGAEIMFLEVAKDNPSAIALYSKFGYQQCGTRAGYYRRGENGSAGRVDALLFQKKLT